MREFKKEKGGFPYFCTLSGPSCEPIFLFPFKALIPMALKECERALFYLHPMNSRCILLYNRIAPHRLASLTVYIMKCLNREALNGRKTIVILEPNSRRYSHA